MDTPDITNDTSDIVNILLELQKRRQGYFFGGPSKEWCEPNTKKYIIVNGKNYSGCKKYADCSRINETKWVEWNNLTSEQQELLRELHCYRVPQENQGIASPYVWDNRYIEVRTEQEWKWVGNPFGIRNQNAKDYLSKYHRDTKPCSMGGCITPEMQFEYDNENPIEKEKYYWSEIKACPYYFKSKDEKFNTFEKNIVRFAQCYVTLPVVTNYLKQNNFITASTLFRDTNNSNKTNLYWYPFFSGYSYLQLLYQMNSDKGWKKFSPQMRWHATAIQRLGSYDMPNTEKIFSLCESDRDSPRFNDEPRFLGVCDGYASWLLLTWIIIKRHKASTENNNIDLTLNLNWEYADKANLFNNLNQIGFENVLALHFKLKVIDNKIIRNSTLKEDLELLGISDIKEQNLRFEYLQKWINKTKKMNPKNDIQKLVDLYPNNYTNLNQFVNTFIDYVKNVFINVSENKTYFIENLVLNPPVHLIVRAFLTTPIRWCFIPINADLDKENKITLTSGIIVLLEDSLESRSYDNTIANDENKVLKKFNNLFPILSAVNNIEEQNLRDEDEKRRRDIEEEKDKQATRAAIADIINRNYAHHIGSHVSNRATFDNVLRKLGLRIVTIQNAQIASVVDMQNSLEKYKDERSEFIASISTSQVSQPFNFYYDIIRPFVENTLLIDNIAANEGVGYFHKTNHSFSKNTISCDYKNDTLSQLVIRVFIHQHLFQNIEKLIDDSEDFRKDLSKVPENYVEQKTLYFNSDSQIFDSLSIPYFQEKTKYFDRCQTIYQDIMINVPGALGFHLIYSLLENYIRNTAKHVYVNKQHETSPIEIILKLHPSDTPDKIIFEITDNISDATKKVKNNDNQEIDLIKSLNNKINSGLIEKQGMGIADMKICACLLDENELTEKNLCKAIVAKNLDGHIAYLLKLSRPKQIALIGCLKDRKNEAMGVFYFDNFNEYVENANLNFQFAILNENFIDKIPNFTHILPLKLFVLSNNQDTKQDMRYSIISSVITDDILVSYCWKKWIENKTLKNKADLTIYFEQKVDELNTKDWCEIESKYNSTNYSLKSVGRNQQGQVNPKFNAKSNNLLFDRHGALVDKFTKGKFIETNFWELLDKNNPDFDIIFPSNSRQEPFTLPFEMMGAALNRVLIIDERVAEVSQRKMEGDSFSELVTHGFRKMNLNKSEATLFDACWAAGIHIATSIKYNEEIKPVSNQLNINILEDYNYLEISFILNKGYIDILSKTNLMELNNEVRNNELGNLYWENDTCEMKSITINYDAIIIHRTKLKELIDYFSELKINFTDLLIPKIFVVTGGGVVDFLGKSGNKPTILTTNILKDFILGGRIAKIALMRKLK